MTLRLSVLSEAFRDSRHGLIALDSVAGAAEVDGGEDLEEQQRSLAGWHLMVASRNGLSTTSDTDDSRES